MEKQKFDNLTEKELKYELFRALRRHEGQRALNILQDSRCDVNWQHAHKGRTVLMQAYFENEAEVFEYLIHRPELDPWVKDDDGRTIYEWSKYTREDDKIEYRYVLQQSRGKPPVTNKKTWMDYIEPLPFFDNNERFSLNLGGHYRLLHDFSGMKKRQVVQFINSYGEMVDKGDYREYYIFVGSDRKNTHVAISSLPKSIKDSYNLFEDAFGDLPNVPDTTRLMVEKLKNRSPVIRENTARKVSPDMECLNVIFSILLKLSLEQSSENVFSETFYRLGDEARIFLESDAAELMANGHRNLHHLLTKLGSTKYLAQYYQMLRESDLKILRQGITYIKQLGLTESLPYFEELMSHKNYNVRSSAKSGIAAIEKG